MEQQSRTREQEEAAEKLFREFVQQLERVAVDMQAAFPRLREIAPPAERQISEDEVEIGFTVDASGIVKTLRGLPDGAGTDAFVAVARAPKPRATIFRHRAIRPNGLSSTL
ncbi:MAG TPA: hypothetical protein VI259_23380 [Gemmatimonadaceae bacterium]